MATDVTSLPRPKEMTGALSWLMTTDHKRIGILYTLSGFAFFLIAGIFALFMRAQLAFPDGKVLTNAQYDQIFTMHGTTMIFLVVMPISVGLGNYPRAPDDRGTRHGIPKVKCSWDIGSFALAGIFLYSSFFFGGAPDKGWFSYAPLTEFPFSANPWHDLLGVEHYHARLFLHDQLHKLYCDDRPIACPGYDALAYPIVSLDDCGHVLFSNFLFSIGSCCRHAPAV